MLEALRKGTGTWIAKIFIALLVLSFAVWGIADIFGGFGARTVASVGDTEISAEDYRREFQRELRSLSNRTSRNVTIADARSMALDSQILLRLIGDAAIENQAKSLRLDVTGQAVGARIKRESAFRDSSGKFSQQRFYQILQANGLSEQLFLERQRRAVVLEQITDTITANNQVPRVFLDAANKFRNETRTLRYVTVPLSKFDEVGEPTAEKQRDYYNTHKSEFRAPEVRKVGAIVLTPDALAKEIEVSEFDIKTYFESNKVRFNTPERRAVLRIPFPDEATANEAYKKLQNGADIMDITKERGLSKEDIDLGVIPKAGLLDKALADAVFSLNVDGFSKPIKGSLATVIAKVTKIEPAVVRTLEDERERIKRLLVAEKAARTILDAYDKIEDERAGGATLAEVGKKLDLKFVEIPAVDARGMGADGKPVDLLSSQPEVLRAIFTSDVGLETDPEETSDRGFIWYEVLEVTKDRQKSFEEVKDETAKKVRESEERALLAQKGQELVDKLRSGEKFADIALKFELEIADSKPMKRNDRDGALPPAALQQAFALKKGDFGSAVTPDGKGRLLFQITESNVPDAIDAKARAEMLKLVAPRIGDDLILQYVRALREGFGVNINQTVFEEATTGRFSNRRRQRFF